MKKSKKIVYGSITLAIVAAMMVIIVPLFASSMDDRIVSSAKKTHVFKTYLKDDNIKMTSKNGIVTLTGTVQDESHKSLAQETVAGLPGVKRVDNNLEEKEKNRSGGKSDAWLITKVKTTLLYHRNVSGFETEVLADNGTITLRGEAPNAAQKELTTEYVMDIDGVEQVNNEMTVANAVASKPDNNTPDNKTKDQKTHSVIETIDDASITALVKTSLLYHSSTSGLGTDVGTEDGVVTLEGTARTSAEKDLAQKYAAGVDGVKRVNNNMTIE